MRSIVDVYDGGATGPAPREDDDDVPPDPGLSGFSVPDLIEVEVGRGGRVVVLSDLHLGPRATEVSTQVADELAEVLDGFAEPGLLVIAGDGFEMLAAPTTLDEILDAHPGFAAAVARFAGRPGHEVVVLPGNHDGQLAWDGPSADVLRTRLGVTHLSLACDVALATDQGRELVRIVHGNQLDRYNRFDDPRSPLDKPFGHYIVREVLPSVQARQSPGSVLDDIQHLDGDPAAMLGSRLLYRKVSGRLWWLAVPFAAALVLRLLALAPHTRSLTHHHSERWLVWFGVLMLAIAVTAVVVGLATMLRVNRALADISISERGDTASANTAARAEAARLINSGYAGLVTGHTHQPEIADLGGGFYANTGCGQEAVRGHRARFGLPRPFLSARRLSMVELIAGPTLAVALRLEEQAVGRPTTLERLVLAPEPDRPQTLEVVGAWPNGAIWPIPDGTLRPWIRRRRVRRTAAFALVGVGLANVALAAAWGIHWTHPVDSWSPIGSYPLHVLTAAIAGLALAGLAKGVRHGYRRSWLAAQVILLVSGVDRLIHGTGPEGAGLTALLGLGLLLGHRHFQVSPGGARRYFGWAVTAGLLTAAVAASLNSVHAGGGWLMSDLTVATITGTVLLALVTALPGREQRRTGEARSRAFQKAQNILNRYGGDTLDYFALRDDKSWLFTGNTLVAYSVLNRTMLVSPDPIGPASERLDAWTDVMDLADQNGWYVSVLGAAAPWLPVYRAAGLTDMYMGDEAIVDCQKFSLSGKSMKSLRGAYNRVSKSGYRVALMKPVDADEQLRRQIEELATETRQGEVERGYSMTLSRMFDPRDEDLLLAVCFDPDGKPVALNQYIPAGHINGYSLDVMRRTSDPGALNGLTDFVILETINWMAEHGLTGLGLNFATMRAVVAGESGDGRRQSVKRSVLHRFSESMQIESLWNFNKKYDPEWRPRYAVLDDRAHLARTGVAIARAESVSELPVVGRIMKPKTPVGARTPEPVA